MALRPAPNKAEAEASPDISILAETDALPVISTRSPAALLRVRVLPVGMMVAESRVPDIKTLLSTVKAVPAAEMVVAPEKVLV